MAKHYELHGQHMTKELPVIFHVDNHGPCTAFPGYNWHENVELLYVISGEGETDCGGQVYSVQTGDIIAVNAYALHGFRSEKGMQAACLIVDREFCKGNEIETNELEFTTVVRDLQAAARYERVMQEYRERKDFFSAGIRSAVLELLVYLCRSYSTPGPSYGENHTSVHECVRFAIEYIKANYDSKLTVDDIAAAVGLSKYYFLREFKRITGHTVINYANIVRCEYAKTFLENGTHSVKDVAGACGFESESYFASVFKKYIGKLPSEVSRKERLTIKSQV